MPADRPVMWANRPGIEPVETTFDVTPDVRDALLLQRGPIELRVVKDDGSIETWSNLWALRETASSDPFRAAVLVSDRRWFWPSRHILRRYNVRRRSGFFRIQANDTPELERVEERFRYAKFSLDENGTKAWTPERVLADLLGDLSAWEARNGGRTFPVRIEGRAPGSPIEDLWIDTSGENGVAMALDQMPGLTLRVDPDGSLVVFSQAAEGGGGVAGAADTVRASIGDEIVGGGHTVTVVHANESPREIHLLVTVEAELRFDYQEQGENATVVADPDEELRVLRNVLPLPDYQLDVDGVSEVQGTYVEFVSYLAALPDLPAGGQLTDAMVRQAFMPFCDLWAAILEIGLLDTDSDWAARVAAVQANFLQTWRLPRGWHDRVLAWKAYRVATVNQATGSRGPAMAFADHALLGGTRSQLRDYRRGRPLVYATNVNGFRETLDSQARPAPAAVSLLDDDQGVVRTDYLLDPYRVYEQVLPAKVDEDTFPAFQRNADAATGSQQPITFDSVLSPEAPPPRLSNEHELALVLTAVPGGPNTNAQLYRIVIKPDDINGLVPARVVTSARKARGPVLEVRLQPSVETARLRWLDSRAGDYEKLFGVGVAAGEPDLTGLCVNSTASNGGQPRGAGGANQGAALDEIARAIAARVWAGFADHPQGKSSGDMRFAIVPRGWTDSVLHEVRPDGTSTTTAHFPQRVPRLDFVPLLKPDAQAVLLRRVYQ